MKVLITGSTGLLGKSLKETKPTDIKLAETWYTNNVLPMYQLNICIKSQVSYIFEQVKPDIVIHCAAIGSVDLAEREFETVRNINVTGTENVLRASKDHDAFFVFVSSNAVYSGDNPPYDENSEREPVNRYGSIKKEAEDIVMAAHNWMIVRPFMLYGWQYPNARKNWATIVIDRLLSGEVTKLVNDVYWQPTLARDVAVAIWRLTRLYPETKNQIYNVASDDRMTLYDFGQKVADLWHKNKSLIEPVGSDYFPSIAPRPVDTTFDCGKVKKMAIYFKNVQEGLRSML